jgi:hypothetical protein
MNNYEKVRDLVNKYVQNNGVNQEMSRKEFFSWVHETYDEITAKNLSPTDISYNRYNLGLIDFPGPNLCLVHMEDRKTLKLVGTGYKYTGPIFHNKGESGEKIVGQWINGVCKMGEVSNEDLQLPESILLRRSDLADGIKFALEKVPISIKEKGRIVTVEFQELLISGVNIEDEGYKIFNASKEWAEKTSYLCNKAEDESWFYYLETIDECIGETQRLVMFESQKNNKKKELMQ